MDEEEWSPAARYDEECYRAKQAKEAAAREAKEAAELVATQRKQAMAPAQGYVTKAQLDRRLDSLCGHIGGELRKLVFDPLVKRIAELEAREWMGVWEQGKGYAKNALVTMTVRVGSRLRAYPEPHPGSGPDSGWRLVVKRGKDAR